MESDAAAAAAEAVKRAETHTWMGEEIAGLPSFQTFPEVMLKLQPVLERWRDLYSKKVWLRIMRKDNRVLKEINECAPIIARLLGLVDAMPRGAPKITVVDLCCGYGFLSMFLAEIMDPAKVDRFVLVDKRWPEAGKAPSANHQSVEHIVGRDWPIPMTIRKQNIKKSREHRDLTNRVFASAPGPVALLSVHLCGGLSCKAVDMFNENPGVVMFALKPCCLPGKRAVRQRAEWTLGGHRFTAEELYEGQLKTQCIPVPPVKGEPGWLVGIGKLFGAKFKKPKRVIRRSAEATARRKEKRRLQLAERRKDHHRDAKPAAAAGSDPTDDGDSGAVTGDSGDVTAAGAVVGEEADAAAVAAAAAGVGIPDDDGDEDADNRASEHAREMPPVPFSKFCGHLLTGIVMPEGEVVAGTSKGIEQIKVQHRYFQNTFLFASRPVDDVTA